MRLPRQRPPRTQDLPPLTFARPHLVVGPTQRSDTCTTSAKALYSRTGRCQAPPAQGPLSRRQFSPYSRRSSLASPPTAQHGPHVLRLTLSAPPELVARSSADVRHLAPPNLQRLCAFELLATSLLVTLSLRMLSALLRANRRAVLEKEARDASVGPLAGALSRVLSR